MRGLLLIVTACAFVSLWGVGPSLALPVAFGVFFANFATYCVLYDRPSHRARNRVAGQMRQLQPQTDVSQRMATARVAPTAADRRLGVGPMTLCNFATGIAGAGLLVWGIVLRIG